MKMLFSFFVLFLLNGGPLAADIEQVVIRWNAGVCTESCIKDLNKYLGKVHGVTKLEVGSTNAAFGWEKGVPFSFSAVDAGMRYVGVRMVDIFLTVSGKVSHTKDTVELRSTNDGTVFTLLGPVKFNPGQAAALKNTESYPISTSQRESLLKAEEENKIVTVHGPLMQPYAAPPLYLVIAEMKMSDEKK